MNNHRRMTCEPAREELSAQLDDERSPALTTTLAEHLSGCTDCRNCQEAALSSLGGDGSSRAGRFRTGVRGF